MADESLADALQSIQAIFDGTIHVDNLTRSIYATDASVYQEIPQAVAIPKTEADIRRLIEFACQTGIGLIPRTAGTSLAGQVVGAGIVVDVSRHFTQVLEIDPHNKWVRAQPGVIRDELNLALAPFAMMFAPETSTANRAMIGGMLGNNSCGSNSIVYGSTRDHVLELRGFLSDGSEATFQALSDDEFTAKCESSNPSMESRLYREFRGLLSNSKTRTNVEREFPKREIHRRNTGYAIDLLMNASPLATRESPSDRRFNFCKLIAGSEGTLFFVTELKLACVPLPPPESGLMCAHFESVNDALLATQIAMKHQPYACELIDHFVLAGAARNIKQRGNAFFVQGSPQAILLIDVRGATRELVTHQASLIERDLRQASLGFHFPVLFDDQVEKAWELRKAGLGSVSNVPGDAKPVAVIEDAAVSLDDLPEFINELDRLLQENYGLDCVHYGHAGAGEIHLRPILNLKISAGITQFRDVAKDVAKLVKKFQGSLSGEHGDGRLRSEFLQQMIGSENYELIKKAKLLWDPRGIFNPGKIVEAPPMGDSLRYRADQSTPRIETYFDFSREQGVVRATELCNGSGDCRKTHLAGGTMCPSYMATRNESDTTRARANLLRQVLSNPQDAAQPFNNKEIKQILDLCLSCKACKRECPSNVDMAKLKAEFQQGYSDANGMSRRAKLIVSMSRRMKWASIAPGIYNWLITNPLTSAYAKKFAGFSDQRSIPHLQGMTLKSWFKTHIEHPNAGSQGSVYVFCDEFTNYFDTQIGIATVELMEQLGFAVKIPDTEESGRSAISQGHLRMAKSIAESNVKLLGPIINEQTPLVGIEPSAILSFRDEYPLLVAAKLRDSATRLAKHCLMLDEFIARQISNSVIKPAQFSEAEQRIRLHGHCHQKALASLAPDSADVTTSEKLLRKIDSVRMLRNGRSIRLRERTLRIVDANWRTCLVSNDSR